MCAKLGKVVDTDDGSGKKKAKRTIRQNSYVLHFILLHFLDAKRNGLQ